MTTLRCDVCAHREMTPEPPQFISARAPIPCTRCHAGFMKVTDERPMRRELTAREMASAPELDEHGERVDPDPWREDLQTGPDAADIGEFPDETASYDPKGHELEGDEPDTRLVVLEKNIAYINVLALMMTLEVDDTPENRNIATAPLAAVLRERGYDPVLVGLDD